MRAVRQMDKETAMTTAGLEMKIRQLSVSRTKTIYYIRYACACACGRLSVSRPLYYTLYVCGLSVELNAF